MAKTQLSQDLADIEALRGFLQRVVDTVKDTRSLASGVGEALRDGMGERFDDKIDPDGKAWQEWALRTVADRRRKGFDTNFPAFTGALYRTGQMFDSLRLRTGKSFAVVEFTDGVAAYHQTGTEKMPARPLLFTQGGGLGTLNEKSLDKVIDEHFSKV